MSSRRLVDAPHTRHLRVLLTLGFLAFAAAVVVAHRNPAVTYELSIYAGTPTAFWVGGGVAALAALVVGVAANSEGVLRRLAGLLLGLASITVISLPVLRGYHYYGAGDALSHLGWTRMLADGRLDPLNFLYPGVHALSLFVSRFTGLPIRTSVLVVVLPVFTGLFVVFAALVGKALVGDSEMGVLYGVASAALLLPLNNVSVHPNAHPASQAIFFSAVCYYVLFRYLRSDRPDGLGVTPVGVLLALTTLAILAVHPQQALNLVVVLATVAGVQFLARRLSLDHAVATQRRTYGQAAFALGAFGVWVPGSEKFAGALFGTINSLFAAGSTAETVSQRSGSLSVLGSSIESLFVKLFLVSTLYCALAGAVMLAASTDRFDGTPGRTAMVNYLTAGFVPLVGVFLLVFFASVGDMYFRYLGFIMVIVTALGAVGLAKATSLLRGRLGDGTVRAIVLAVLLVVVPLAAVTVHPSPYIYQSSGHVTERTLDGYETSFEHRDPTVEWAGIRGGPRRYVDAHYGTTSPTAETFPGRESDVPFAVFGNNLTDYYDQRRYVPLPQGTVAIEVGMYDGFRYPATGFDRLDATPRVHRVQANDGYRLYLVVGDPDD